MWEEGCADTECRWRNTVHAQSQNEDSTNDNNNSNNKHLLNTYYVLSTVLQFYRSDLI